MDADPEKKMLRKEKNILDRNKLRQSLVQPQLTCKYKLVPLRRRKLLTQRTRPLAAILKLWRWGLRKCARPGCIPVVSVVYGVTILASFHIQTDCRFSPT